MKQTLYQILGVESNATPEEIAAAYGARKADFEAGTLQDPNQMVALRQAHEVLADTNQRAAYDAALANRAAPPVVDTGDEPEPTFVQQWLKWIVAAAIAIAIIVWWSGGSSTKSSAVVGPAASPSDLVEEELTPVARSSVPRVAPESLPAQVEETPDNPLWGKWSCYEAVSGRASTYNFRADGTLDISSSSGGGQSAKYQLGNGQLLIDDAGQSRTLRIESGTRRKMILNMGNEGRRLVCQR